MMQGPRFQPRRSRPPTQAADGGASRSLAVAVRAGALALAGAALLAASCTQHSQPEVPEAGGSLRVAVLEAPDLPSPLYCERPLTLQLLEHVTPPLGRIDEQGQVRLLLATRSVDNGAWIDYTLRRARWQDGVPVTPRDLALTATLLGDYRVQSPARAQVELLRGASARDDSTLRLEYMTTYSQRVHDSLLFPVPAHRFPPGLDMTALRNSPFCTQPLACGPFRFVPGPDVHHLVLVRNDGAGFAPARLDTVRVEERDEDGAVRDFQRGTVDVLVDLPVGRVRDVQDRRRGVRIVALVGRSYLFVGWNLRDARFTDPEVRRAAAQAVDVRRMIRELSHGQGDRARGPLTVLHGFADTTAVLPYDPSAAARALDAAGWRAGPHGVRERRGAQLSFHVLAPAEDPLRVAAAKAMVGDLRRIGMVAEVRELPTPLLLQRLARGQFEAYAGQWFPEPGVDLDPVWRSDATDQWNFGGYASPGADSLLTAMRHELVGPRREQVLSRFQARVYADQPYLFLFQNPHFVIFAPRVRGAEPTVVSPFWNLPEWWIPRGLRSSPRAAGP